MTIGEFLFKLACEGELYERFIGDAEGAMRHAGLNAEQIRFLQLVDLSDLRVKVEAEFKVAGEVMFIPTICMPTICMPTPSPPTPTDPDE